MKLRTAFESLLGTWKSKTCWLLKKKIVRSQNPTPVTRVWKYPSTVSDLHGIRYQNNMWKRLVKILESPGAGGGMPESIACDAYLGQLSDMYNQGNRGAQKLSTLRKHLRRPLDSISISYASWQEQSDARRLQICLSRSDSKQQSNKMK